MQKKLLQISALCVCFFISTTIFLLLPNDDTQISRCSAGRETPNSVSIDRIIEFPHAGFDNITILPIEGGSTIASAEINLTFYPYTPNGTDYPMNITVDIGADKQIDWHYKDVLGRQTVFTSLKKTEKLNFIRQGIKSANVTIPKSTVNLAKVSLSIPPMYDFTYSETVTASATTLNAVVTADIDANGFADLIGCDNDGKFWVAKFNKSLQKFSQAFEIGATRKPLLDADVADVDIDGWYELVGVSADGDVYIADNIGFGVFGMVTKVGSTGTRINAVATGDLNNDGAPDFALASDNGDFYVGINNRNNNFAISVITTNSRGRMKDVKITDINQDGRNDLVGCNSDGYVYIATNVGFPNFAVSSIGVNPQVNLNSIDCGDVNNDCLQDFVVVSGDGYFYAGYNTGLTFVVSQLTSGVSNLNSVKIVDFDTSGWADIVASSPNGIISLRQNCGNGTFSDFQQIPTLFDTNDIAFADIGSNGTMDIIVATIAGHFCIVVNTFFVLHDFRLEIGGEEVWYRNASAQLFNTATTVTQTPETLHSVTTADVDNDGDLDIIAGDWRGNFQLSYNLGNLTFSSPTQVRAADYREWLMYGCTAVDLSADAFPEIIGVTRSGAVYIAENQRGRFTQGILIDSLSYLNAIYDLTTADIDNDGDMDIVCVAKDGNFYKIGNLGSLNFGPLVNIGGTPASLYGVTGIDVNFDGYVDFVASSADGSFYCLINNKNGTFSPPYRINAASTPMLGIASADFDRDGDFDIIGCNQDGNFYLSLFDGNVFQTAIRIPTGTAVDMLCVYTAALDKDGDYDVVGGSSDGYLYVLLNNGDATFQLPKRIDVDLPHQLISVTCKDVDRDGDTDVIAANLHSRVHISPSNLHTFAETTPDFSTELQNALDLTIATPDEYDNPLATVSLQIHSNYPGSIILSDLDVRYQYTAEIPNAKSVIENLIASSTPNATYKHNIPVNITCGSSGKIRLQIKIDYSRCPPSLDAFIPSTYRFFEDPEGGVCRKLIDLERYFSDDRHDGRLIFHVIYQENPSNLSAVVEDGHYLSFYPKKHWPGKALYYGCMNFTVRAIDLDDPPNVRDSNRFYVTVVHRNHPPELDTKQIGTSINLSANVNRYLNLTSYINDVEDGKNLTVDVLPHNEILFRNITLTNDNRTLNHSIKFSYPDLGYHYTKSILIRILDSEDAHTDWAVVLHIWPYGMPVWLKAVPDHITYMNKNITYEDGSLQYNLKNYVYDPNTTFENLIFTVDWVDKWNFTVGIYRNETGCWLTARIKTNYIGSTVVLVNVTDGYYYALTSFRLIVKKGFKEIIYLGGLKKFYEVYEDTTWQIFFEDYFEFEIGNTYFTANSPEINIDNYAYSAAWSPVHGSASIYDLIFTAVHRIDPNITAHSDPIDLIYIDVNDPPVYVGNLQPALVEEGTTWEVDLARHFTDEEDPLNLTFRCNRPEITIRNSVASWTPKHDATTLTNVIFTVIDAVDKNLTASSPPITLTFVPLAKRPTAYIDAISPNPANLTDVVTFSGHGEDVDGEIVAYRWWLDKDRDLKFNVSVDILLSNRSSFTMQFNTTGTFLIVFQVEDDEGYVSEPVHKDLIIKPPPHPKPFLKLTTLAVIVAGVLIIAGIVLNAIGKKYME